MSQDSMTFVTILASIIATGILSTFLLIRIRREAALKERLSFMVQIALPKTPTSKQQYSTPDWITDLLSYIPKGDKLKTLIERAGFQTSSVSILSISLALLLIPPLVAFALDLPIEIALLVGVILATIPFFVLTILAEQMRERFTEQLPNAINLMISVLRSGLSILQSVKSVSEEIPAPCGTEFTEIMHRLNLGQPLPEALSYTVEKYNSFELDLVRRATALQLEVGGSLAELFDKTNATLQERLKLKKQVKVLTAQSRLSGIIISLMPIVVAIVFESMHHGYLRPLFETNLGKILLTLAVFLQIVGTLVIRKLSTFKV